MAVAGLLCAVLSGWGAYWRFGKKLILPGLLMALTASMTWSKGGLPWYVPAPDGIWWSAMMLVKMACVSFYLGPLVVAQGVWNIEITLERWGLPEKMRAMLILTVRYIFMLKDSFSTKIMAFSCRAGSAPLSIRLKGLAALFGTTLIQCHDRAQRAWFALQLRGGMAGFKRAKKRSMVVSDWLLIIGSVAVVVIALEAQKWLTLFV